MVRDRILDIVFKRYPQEDIAVARPSKVYDISYYKQATYLREHFYKISGSAGKAGHHKKQKLLHCGLSQARSFCFLTSEASEALPPFVHAMSAAARLLNFLRALTLCDQVRKFAYHLANDVCEFAKGALKPDADQAKQTGDTGFAKAEDSSPPPNFFPSFSAFPSISPGPGCPINGCPT